MWRFNPYTQSCEHRVLINFSFLPCVRTDTSPYRSIQRLRETRLSIAGHAHFPRKSISMYVSLLGILIKGLIFCASSPAASPSESCHFIWKASTTGYVLSLLRRLDYTQKCLPHQDARQGMPAAICHAPPLTPNPARSRTWENAFQVNASGNKVNPPRLFDRFRTACRSAAHLSGHPHANVLTPTGSS